MSGPPSFDELPATIVEDFSPRRAKRARPSLSDPRLGSVSGDVKALLRRWLGIADAAEDLAAEVEHDARRLATRRGSSG